MWSHYRKTFTGMQITIWLVTLSVYLFVGHSLIRAATFFVVMQMSAVIGALWGVRLRGVFQRRTIGLPLRAQD
jgi:hypothetical protein